MCWPSVGGGLRTPGVACEYFKGVFTSLTGPQAGWSTSATIPRAWTRMTRYISDTRLIVLKDEIVYRESDSAFLGHR